MPRPSKRNDRTSEALLQSLVAQIDQRSPESVSPDTVPTGFPSVDRVLGGGVRQRDLVVLAGDVGSGKSALGLSIGIRAATADIPTLPVR
jgi:replicative DNA helicase